MASSDFQRVMKIISALFILILLSPINAQWASFDLNKADAENFSKAVKPFLQSVSLSNTNHFNTISENNKRLHLGVAYSQVVNISGEETSSKLIGGYPNIYAGYPVSENLQLKGNISLFNSGDDVVQSFAYGLGLKLTNKESNNWRMSILFSQLRGPDDISMKSVDANVNYNFRLANISLYAGLGVNTYNAKILLDDDTFPNKIKSNANHLLVGSQLNVRDFIISPLLLFNSDIIILTLEISGTFL